MKKILYFNVFSLFISTELYLSAHTEDLSIFSPEAIDILKNNDLSAAESAQPFIKLFKDCCNKMGISVPFFIIPGWSYLNRGTDASFLFEGKKTMIISDSSVYCPYDGTQAAVFNHELGHAIIHESYNHLINGYALSKGKQIICGGSLLLLCSYLLHIYSQQTRKPKNQIISHKPKFGLSEKILYRPSLRLKARRNSSEAINSSEKKSTFSKKAFLFSIPTTIGASVLALKDYAQLNESIADTLAIVKGGSKSSSIANFLTTPRTIDMPSEEIAKISNNFNKLCLKNYPLLAKIVYLIFPMHPSTTNRINLAKHLENKYPNGTETINEQTIKQLRTDILRYNKVSLCAEYALYAAAGYLTYKTVRMFAEDDLLPYSSKINTFFEKVDQKVDDCKIFVKNKVSQSLEYFTSKSSENSEG